MNRSASLITITVIVSNAAEEIEAFHARLSEITRDISPLDILYVDDGSSDGTDRKLRDIASANSQVRVLRLSRPFGPHGSVAAGLQHSPGEATILLIGADAPLFVIPELMSRWHEGSELVWAHPEPTSSQPATGTDKSAARFQPDEATAALFSQRVLQIYRSLPHRGDAAASLLAQFGFRQSTVTFPTTSPPRKPAARELLLRFGNQLIQSSVLPVRMISTTGVVLGIAAFLYSVFIVLRALFFDLGDFGWPSLAVTLLFLGSCQMISLGIIIEYIWRIYQQTEQTPRYIIQEQLGVPARTPDAAWSLDPNDLDTSQKARPMAAPPA